KEGATYTLTLGKVSDPGADTVSQYIVHWGDGNSNTYTSGGAQTHTYTGLGSRAITVDLVDEDGTHLNRANALSVQVDRAISLARIDDGLTAQRSMVRSLTVVFSASVATTLSEVMASLSLTRTGGGTVSLTGTLDTLGTTLTLKFTGAGIVGGSLADGRYT